MAEKAFQRIRNATDNTLISNLDADEMKFIDCITGTHGFCMQSSKKKFKSLKNTMYNYAIKQEWIHSKPISPANDKAYYFVAKKHADVVKQRNFPEDASMWTKNPFNWKVKEDFVRGYFGPDGLIMFVLTEYLKPIELAKRKRKEARGKTPKKKTGTKRTKLVGKLMSVLLILIFYININD